jgi:uroporphyrin-III C-methyltransferase
VNKHTGKVHLVGAGPGDPDLLTVRASALLHSADIVLHDDLVSGEIVALANPRAIVLNVGKRSGAKKISQSEINGLMIASARRGMNVVRLKSGDPAIFGRLNEELDALEAADVSFEVVPGVTAGLAAAASLSASLTDRRQGSRILIVSGHHAQENERENKNDWSGVVREDVTLVVYMPGHEFGAFAGELLAAGLLAETPSVIVSRATTPDEHRHWTTLGQLAHAPHLKSPTVLLIGRSLRRASNEIDAENDAGANDVLSASSLLEFVDLDSPWRPALIRKGVLRLEQIN